MRYLGYNGLDMGLSRGAVLLLGEAGSPCNTNVACAEAYLHTKWHLDPFSRLATIDMGRKLGAVIPFGGKLSPHVTQSRLGRGLPPYQVAS